MADAQDPKLLEQLGEIFADLFGRAAPAADLRRELRISLLEAAHGAERELEDVRTDRCTRCDGKGGAEGARYRECTACAGRGQTTVQQGMFQISKVCPECQGAGGQWSEPCAECGGRGWRSRPGKWTVTIPPGVAAGHVLRLKSQGNDLGEGPGDLLLEIAIDAHPILRRRGDDLLARVPIEGSLARDGGELRVPWLEGEAILRVPRSCAHGTEIVLAGWGCARLGQAYAAPPAPGAPYRAGATSARGDLIVTLLTEPVVERDPFDVLGLPPSATPGAIQDAYRKLAVQMHPDRHPSDPDAVDRFEELGRAYTKLIADAPERAAPQHSRGGGSPWIFGGAVLALAAIVYLLFFR
ncbi:MAG: DnaJ domain-containing protein [Sandaracinaceae bacterium]|nr:DnaJ domain-containing protein [Sandaracinaceae bacterium]